MSKLETLLFFILEVINKQQIYKNEKCLVSNEESGQETNNFIKSSIDNISEKMMKILIDRYLEYNNTNIPSEPKLLPSIPVISNNRMLNNNLLGNGEVNNQKDIFISNKNSPNPFLEDYCFMNQSIFNSPSCNKIDEKFTYKKNNENHSIIDNFIKLERIQSFDLQDVYKNENFHDINKIEKNNTESLLD